MMQDPKILCDVCQGEMNRKPQPAGVKFYGTGFYTTDKHDKH
jgi:predicted nucleic acid-binding Zn ribbon protein